MACSRSLVPVCASWLHLMHDAHLGPGGQVASLAAVQKTRQGDRRCLWQVLILGGGPNRIGQGIEFDYCCCHASFALRRDLHVQFSACRQAATAAPVAR